MTALAIILCVACQFFLAIGQVLLKRAMSPTRPDPKRTTINFVAGVACLTAWFFLWVGLLQSWDLSRIFPFEGLNSVLVVIGAMIFLRERFPATAWIGIGLITAGVTLVSAS